MLLLEPKTLKPRGEFVVWDSFYLVQPTVVSLGGENLLVFFRDRRKENIYMARSYDGGRTWTDPKPTALPNNNSGIHAARLKSNDILIVRDPWMMLYSKTKGVLKFEIMIEWFLSLQILPLYTSQSQHFFCSLA